MAKKSVEARQRKRERLVALYAERRALLKKEGKYQELDALPRNSSPVRLRKRCALTGRSRGYIGYFGISRLVFREMALAGRIPGVKKSSW